MKKILLAVIAATVSAAAPAAPDGGKPVDAMLVVQNHVSDDFKKPLSDLGDRISAALSGDHFHVIDPNDAIGENLNRGPWGERLPPTSAVRLAGDLGAQALITASVGEASVVGIGNPVVAQSVSMTLTLAVKKVPSGAGVAAVTVTEASRPMTPEVLSASRDRVYSDLVGKLVAKAAAQFMAKAATADMGGMEANGVTVFFGCNVLGADVEVDGLSLGTCPGQFSVVPGVHSVRVSYPPYYYDFRKQAKLTENGQTFAVVLQINPEGEKQRLGALDYEKKRSELELWRRDREFDLEARKNEIGFEYEKGKHELELEFAEREKKLEAESAERAELFKKQLALADAMLKRYKLSGETDDYVRKTIADGTSIYWQNSYGRIAITDGKTEDIEFATPATHSGDIIAPSNHVDIGESLQRLLMHRPDEKRSDDGLTDGE